MKRHFFYILASVAVMSACTVEGTYTGERPEPPPPPPQGEPMSLTTQGAGDKTISMSGSGTVYIDWGDGSTNESHTLSPAQISNFSHSYSATTKSIIQIFGNNISYLKCNKCQLTALGVSKNTALAELFCSINQLKEVDVSKNTALKKLDCSFNQLSSLNIEKNTALTELSCNNNELTNFNASHNLSLISLDISTNKLTTTSLDFLLGTLHNIMFVEEKIIYIAINPGTGDSQKSVAQTNGWTVDDNRVWVVE